MAGSVAYSNGAANVESSGFADVKSHKSGCHVSKCTGFALFLLVAGLITATGLIVYYVAVPTCDEVTETPTTTLSPEAQLQQCMALAEERGECICYEEPTVAPTEEPTPEELPTGLRLNKTVLPYHYNIELQPYLYGADATFGLDGHVAIWVTCMEATNQITLHIEQLTIQTASVYHVDASSVELLASHEEDVPRQFLHLHLSEMLAVNATYVIDIVYNGTTLHDDLGGLYRSDYLENGVMQSLVTSQFQRTDARRAMPCFDEPEFKATYNSTVVRMNTHVSISNMEIISTEDRGDGWLADVYSTTPKMSTYLLAYVVCQFEQQNVTSPAGTTIRIWSRPDYINEMAYALEVSWKIMEAFEDYLGIKNPVKLTDQVAVPDFAAGAMENWGLVTYREQGLLYNPEYSTMNNKRYIATIIAHEFAHMWFGNLVTCGWWSDTWLNEGFANFMADYGAGLVETTWKMDEYYIRTVENVLVIDGSVTSGPIYLPEIEHHDELRKAFSSIQYRKGGSVIRMLKHFMDQDTFKAALNIYLNKFAYGNVYREDFYSVMEEVAVSMGTNTWDPSVRNLSQIMETWIDQMNYPLVTVDYKTGDNTTYVVSQKRFLYNYTIEAAEPEYTSPLGDYIWDIPLTYSRLQNQYSYKWMYRTESEEIEGMTLANLVNVQQRGFYRVHYGDEIMGRIRSQLMDDHTIIPVKNRGQILDDGFNLARAEMISEVEALKNTQYMVNEREYLPWYATVYARIPYYENMLYHTESYALLRDYLTTLVVPAFDDLGYNNTNPDEHLEKYLRDTLTDRACEYRYYPCLVAAIEQYQDFMTMDTNPIYPDLRQVFYCVGIKNGGTTEFDYALMKYNDNSYTGYIATEKTWLIRGMSCSEEPWIQRRLMTAAVGWNSTEDRDNAFIYLAQNLGAQYAVWDFLEESWDHLPEGFPTTSVLTALTNNYASEYHLSKLESFIELHPHADLTSYYASRVTYIKDNIVWMSKNYDDMTAWLTEVMES